MDFTGERYVPGFGGWPMEADHLARYSACTKICAGKRVLDAACGTGYGSAMLAETAANVVGIDVDGPTVDYAAANFSSDSVRFLRSSVLSVPVPDDSFDVVISFETLEHLTEDDQVIFIAETRRVLDVGGVLVISTPDIQNTIRKGFANEYHLFERGRADFEAALRNHYETVEMYFQNIWFYSEIAPIARPTSMLITSDPPPGWGQNLIAVCSDSDLPEITFASRIEHDFAETEMNMNHHAREHQKRLHALKESYEGSFSWRVTRPLRWVRGRLG